MNRLRTKNYELRTQQAFTLIELVVAVAILAMVMSFVGIIFKFGIGSYRAAVANAQIMRKLRAVTNQLNSDFKGLRRDAPLLIWFEQYPDPCYPNDPTKYQRFDQIMFFAAGDFQSTQLYADINGNGLEPADSGFPIRGNLARIHYAQAQLFDPIIAAPRDPYNMPDPDRILARRRHILPLPYRKANGKLYYGELVEWPDPCNVGRTFRRKTSYGVYNNEAYEHDTLPLSRWKTLPSTDWPHVIAGCFDLRPEIAMHDHNTFHKLMCEGMGSLKIQWAYWDPTTTLPDPDKTGWHPPAPLRWYPDNDPRPGWDRTAF